MFYKRREFLQIGSGLVASGGTLPWGSTAFSGEAGAVGPFSPASSVRRAKTCILVYLLGGPPHLDTFDLKPHAPADIRGPFKPISTAVPGLQICEHLPQLARIADRYALVRSVSHPDSRHTPMIYYTLTGHHSPNARKYDVRPPLRSDHPHIGSVLAKLVATPASVPGFVALPELPIRSSTDGEFKRARSPLRGGRGGFLGSRYDPFAINGAPGDADKIASLTLPKEVTEARFQQRLKLLSLLNRRWHDRTTVAEYGEMQETAFSCG